MQRQTVSPIDATKSSIEQLKSAWAQKKPMVGIKILVTHENEHFDEILAQYIFKKYGEKIFLEAKKIPVGFINNNQISSFVKNQKEAFWELLTLGYLCMGMSGGPLDDHAKINEKECTATLMARHLGVINNPELSRILEYALFTDKNGDRIWENNSDTKMRNIFQAMLPAKMVKKTWSLLLSGKINESKANSAIESIHELIDVEVESQKDFHKKKAEIAENMITIKLSEKHIAVFTESSHPLADKISRSVARKKFWNAKIVLTVVANPTNGSIAFLNSLDPSCKTNLCRLAGELRKIVAKKRGVKIPADEKCLFSTGVVLGIPLFLHPEHGNIFNGTFSHPTDDPLFKRNDGLGIYEICNAIKNFVKIT